MQAHKYISLLRKIVRDGGNKEFGTLSNVIQSAVKFEIDTQMYMETLEHADDVYELGKHTKLPFPTCYFELPGLVTIIALQDTTINDSIAFSMIVSHPGKDEHEIFHQIFPPSMTLMVYPTTGRIICPSDTEGEFMDVMSDDASKNVIRNVAYCILDLLTLLNTPSTVVENEAPSHKVIRQRKKKGQLPFFSYKVVKVNVNQLIPNRVENADHHERVSPRVHLRRGHLRRYQSGKEVWIDHMVIGDKTKGMIMKDYEVTN
jgi:hypothetical protein